MTSNKILTNCCWHYLKSPGCMFKILSTKIFLLLQLYFSTFYIHVVDNAELYVLGQHLNFLGACYLVPGYMHTKDSNCWFSVILARVWLHEHLMFSQIDPRSSHDHVATCRYIYVQPFSLHDASNDGHLENCTYAISDGVLPIQWEQRVCWTWGK